MYTRHSILLTLIIAIWPAVAVSDAATESEAPLEPVADSAYPIPGIDQPEFAIGSVAASSAAHTPEGLRPESTVFGRLVPAGQSALEPSTNYDKSTPRPKKVRWPKPKRTMYRQAHKHPSVVVSYTSSPPEPRDPNDPVVYVNVPGTTYHTDDTRVVHTNPIQLPKSRAEELGYKPNPYSNPDGERRPLNNTAPR